MTRSELSKKGYQAETQWVAQVAKSIQLENPSLNLSWGECIRLAEKALRERKTQK